MTKKVFSLMLLCAVVVFASCSKDDDSDVAVSGITLNKTTLSLAVDGTATLVATVAPEDATDKSVTWSTSDATVATVTDGVVKGVKVGQATITATSVADPTKKATCTVEVMLKLVYFPDANVRAALKAVIPGLVEIEGDIDPTSTTNKSLIEGVTELDLSNKDIASLKGLEYFSALKTLKCSGNKLTELDITNNVVLETLYCGSNQLPALDITKNVALKVLDCNNNKLAVLDLTKTTLLESLNCVENQLLTLDLSANTKLTNMECSKNNISALDLSKNTLLTQLACSVNKLTTLDLSLNLALEKLNCESNQLTTLDISMLTSLVVTPFTCGNQKDASGANRTLTLVLTSAQKNAFNDQSPNNVNVALSVIKWAKGNLVANGKNGAKIGAPTDGGLYFQFGSLVGWSETGSPTIAVKPADCTVTSWSNSWTGNPAVANSATGTGDPCKYYLKETWRLPTKEEYAELFNNTISGWGTTGWSWNASSKSVTNTALNLTFPATGYRDPSNGSLFFSGSFGYYWSTSEDDATDGYNLFFSTTSGNPVYTYNRALGFPVRCIRD